MLSVKIEAEAEFLSLRGAQHFVDERRKPVMKQVAILSLIVLSSVWRQAQAQGLTESQVYLDVPDLCQREVQTAAINYAHAFDRSAGRCDAVVTYIPQEIDWR